LFTVSQLSKPGKRSGRLPLLAFFVLISVRANAADVLVAVAANFRAPMAQLSVEFANQTGHSARLVYGSSGKFVAQITHGAPFELFLSADQAKPAALVEAGLAAAQSRFTYATGALALWSARVGIVDPLGAVLTGGGFTKLAIANPVLAPYGTAAQQVLQHFRLPESVQLVQGENIAQTYQFVSSGNAELGLVAQSQVFNQGRLQRGSAWKVPPTLHAPIHQDLVLLNRGQHNPAAKALVKYLHGDQARKIIQSFGYSTGAND